MHGSEIDAKNKHGLNVLHIAAQGDQPVSLYFFHKIKNMSITQEDDRGSTPLHWACFSCSELALIFILAWVGVEELGMQDQDGYTPLHLAVKSCDELRSSRPVRALLFKDAPLDVLDHTGKRPIDFVS